MVTDVTAQLAPGHGTVRASATARPVYEVPSPERPFDRLDYTVWARQTGVMPLVTSSARARAPRPGQDLLVPGESNEIASALSLVRAASRRGGIAVMFRFDGRSAREP